MNNLKILNTAFSQYGVKEIPGDQDNVQILEYFNCIGFDGSKLHDETAWCSAFMNWVAETNGLDHSGELTARSWLRVGEKVEKPMIGDVTVLWREHRDSWKGHVGIYIRHDEKSIYLLGGNQDNQVKIKKYPKDRLLGFRRL